MKKAKRRIGLLDLGSVVGTPNDILPDTPAVDPAVERVTTLKSNFAIIRQANEARQAAAAEAARQAAATQAAEAAAAVSRRIDTVRKKCSPKQWEFLLFILSRPDIYGYSAEEIASGAAHESAYDVVKD